jgi:uncharacterized protein
MADIAEIEQVLSPITAWARARTDIEGLALVGSWARSAARPDSDIDLVLLALEPLSFRHDERWLAEIAWRGVRVVQWHDADYDIAWSRHVQLEPRREIEFTFCALSWVTTDPVDPGTAIVVSSGCRVLLDKTRLLENLLAVTTP